MLCKEKDILTIKEQYRVYDEILKERLTTLLPQIMKDTGTEMWLVLCREYNEDPVFKTMTPMLVKNASRTSGFVFSLEGDEFHAYSICRPNPRYAPFYEQAFFPREDKDLYVALGRLIEKHKPSKVAINVHNNCAQADGLSKFLWDDLTAALPEVAFEADNEMAIRWLSVRTERELQMYPAVYDIAMTILREAFSTDVITPGVTTTTDVEYYIMQRMNDMGLDAWFAPDIDLQRRGSADQRMCDTIIQEGDLLHSDTGLTYLGGLYTDTQRNAYVLRKTEGETEIPQGILDGFARGNRFQDIVCENFITGRTGNEIFAASVEQAKAENIRPQLYTHPIGFYGHAAGPTIGLWDNQGFVPGHGEEPLLKNTCFALELNISETVPEWDNQDVCFMLEETVACVGDGKVNYMDNRRKDIIVIG